MQIIVVSDSHGLVEPLQRIKEVYRDADAFIHCGDSELDREHLEGFVVVNGNNDYYSDFPNELVVDVDDYKIFVAHGHLFVRSRLVESLATKAINHHCKLALYGHTHVFKVDTDRGVTVVNPGSMRYNRDGTKPSFAVITITDGEIQVERHDTDEL